MGLSLKFVLLGMVVERPGYGYELQARIDERLPFLRYSPNAVYPALDRLEQEGLIRVVGTKDSISTVRGSPRVIYAATDDGSDRFKRWMYTPTAPDMARDELFAKLSMARAEDIPRLLEMARRHEAILREQLGALSEAPAPAWTSGEPVSLRLVGARLVRAAEARRLSGAIESLQEIREALEYELHGPSRGRSPELRQPRR